MGFYQTSVGKKVVMAITGFIVFGFVIVHLLGNLQVFLGPDTLNQYAAFLQGLGGTLWVFRAIPLASIGLHILAATQVTLQSWAARPHGYAKQRYRETTYAARTMRWGGPLVGLFVIYHLLHFTTGDLHPRPSGFAHVPGQLLNVYNNVIYGFQVWWASAIYIVAIIAIGFHLYHGVWSMMQTIGLNHPKWNGWRNTIALAFAFYVWAVGVSIPVAVLVGYLQPV